MRGMSFSGNGQLRVGLLMDSLTLPAWAYEMLLTVRQAPYAQIEVIVLNDSPVPKKRGLFRKIVENWNTILYIAYAKLENSVFAPNPDAFEPRNAAELLRDIPIIRVKPHRTKYADWFHDADIERVSTYQLDVFVRLGFRILRGRILQA